MATRLRAITGAHATRHTLGDLSEPLDFLPTGAETLFSYIAITGSHEVLRAITLEVLVEGANEVLGGADPYDVAIQILTGFQGGSELFGQSQETESPLNAVDMLEQMSRSMADALGVHGAEGVNEGVREIGRLMHEEESFPVDTSRLSARAVSQLKLGENLPSGRRPPFPNRVSMQGAFNIVNPEVRQYAATRAGTLVRNITQDATDTLRRGLVDILTQSQRGPTIGAEKFAQMLQREVLPNIPLDGPRQRRLTKYIRDTVVPMQTKLREDWTNQQRALGLSDAQIKRKLLDEYLPQADARYQNLVAQKRASLLHERAQVIARTEIQFAANHGKLAAYRSAADDLGLFRKETAGKQWITGPEGGTRQGRHVCPICAPMNGKTVGLDQPFHLSGVTLDTPPAHPRCRCTFVLVPDAFPDGVPTDADENESKPRVLTPEQRVQAAEDRIRKATGIPPVDPVRVGTHEFNVGPRVDLRNMDPDLAELLASRIERFSADFPAAAHNLDRVIMGDRLDFNMGTMAQVRYLGQLDHGLYDDTHWKRLPGGKSSLELNPTYFGRYASQPLGKTMTRAQASGFHPYNDKGMVIDHELGHVLSDHAYSVGVQPPEEVIYNWGKQHGKTIPEQYGNLLAPGGMNEEIVDHFGGPRKFGTVEGRDGQQFAPMQRLPLGEYGSANPAEMWAQLFAMGYNGRLDGIADAGKALYRDTTALEKVLKALTTLVRKAKRALTPARKRPDGEWHRVTCHGFLPPELAKAHEKMVDRRY